MEQDAAGGSLEQDRQSIAAWRQNLLNKYVLEEARKASVSRETHRLMLKQLVCYAYQSDPQRKSNINLWKGILLCIEKEYLGANALVSLSPDPYHEILAKLSSMMIWNNATRHWEYSYFTDEMNRSCVRRSEVLAKLRQSGKLFLTYS